MVPGEQRVQICVCLAVILCLRLASCRFFDGHVILGKFFKAPVHLLTCGANPVARALPHKSRCACIAL